MPLKGPQKKVLTPRKPKLTEDRSPAKTPENSFIGHLCVGGGWSAMVHLAQPHPSIRTLCGKVYSKYVPYPGTPALICEVCKNV